MSRKGYIQSKEHKKKIGLSNSIANKGKHCSLDTEFKKGHQSWNKGKKYHLHLSEEQRKKRGDVRKGSKSSSWKGGITPKNVKIRTSIESHLWRESIFVRDNWTCQKCEKRGIRLHPHHILNFAQYPELRFAIDNGITFCQECHKKFHKKFGIKNNNEEQIREFQTGD